jgi:hypothetical protein
MRILLFVLLVSVICWLVQPSVAQPYRVPDTLTYCELTPQEIVNIYSPIAYGFMGGTTWPTKPSVYFRPRKYSGRFQIMKVYAHFIKPGNWQNASCQVKLCEGLANTGPQETKRYGRPVTITATGVTSEKVFADFSDQNIILNEGTSFYVVYDVSNRDGSPNAIAEDLDYTPTGGKKYRDSGNSWVFIYPTAANGWQKIAATPWGQGDKLADFAIYAIVEYIDVESATDNSTWEKFKSITE